MDPHNKQILMEMEHKERKGGPLNIQLLGNPPGFIGRYHNRGSGNRMSERKLS